MLNVTAQKSSAGAKEYFARSDYYTKDSQELVGHWGGKGAVLLGLSGEVSKVAFERLCDNLHPQTGKQLTRITRDDRRVGYDFTWSAPKSVSVVHALTGDERIAQVFRESIHKTMTEMEADTETRVRKGDADHTRPTGNLAWAEFVHLTSRPVDGMPCPQLHAHLFAFNATYDLAESKWKAAEFARIKSSGFYWQAVQQVRFANRLQQLGYSIRKTKDAFEIVGVPEMVLKKFSLRRGVIERLAEKLGITNPKAWVTLAKKTREAKLDSIPYSELVERWDKQLTPDERVALLEVHGEPKKMAYQNAKHVKFATEHLFERASVVDERRLLSTALRDGIGEVTPEGVRAEVKKLGLLRRERNGKMEVTTQQILKEERQILGFATQSKGTCRPLVGNEEISFEDKELDQEQRRAVEMPLRSTDRIVILKGKAGTGKTRAIAEAVRQLEHRGKEVIFVAPTVKAVGVLHNDGFGDAATLEKLLIDREMQLRAQNGFIVLDEAGMVGSESMNRLFALAKEANARIILLGDTGQLPAVSYGSPLRLLEESAGLKVVEIAEIRRQEPAGYRDAVKLLSRGKTEEGLKKLDAMGCVKLMPVWDSYQPIASDYADKVANAVKAKRDPDAEALIVVPTHAEGQRVTNAVRTEMRRRGLLGSEDQELARLVPLQWTEAERGDAKRYESGDEIVQFHRNTGIYKAGQRIAASAIVDKLGDINAANFAVYSPTTVNLAAGDLIRATARGKTLDKEHELTNGAIYRVKGFDDHGNVRLATGWVVSKDFGHWAHAYTSTAYAAQGRTCQHVLIAQSAMSFPASSRESFYVAASRGRKSIAIYTDDIRDLMAAVRRTNPRLSATELQKRPKSKLWRRMRERIAKMQLGALVAAKAAARHRRQELTYAR